MTIKMHDFTENKAIPPSTYGGKTGAKLCVLHHDEMWFLKFPQTLSRQGAVLSYPTMPVSEFLGSQIYKSIGIDTHDTELGIYKDRPVVACKDFIPSGSKFYEFKGLFNALPAIKSLQSTRFGNAPSLHKVELSDIFEEIEITFAPSAQEKMKERFWYMFVVDCFINNKDRNTGNWGYFMNLTGDFVGLAPVYDNGSSFFPKADSRKCGEKEFLDKSIRKGKTSFFYNGKAVDSVSVMRKTPCPFQEEALNSGLQKAILKITPRLSVNMDAFQNLISDMPLDFKGVPIISESRKAFYQNFLSKRLELVLEPAWKRVMEITEDENA